MKVKQLISKLKKCPQNADIVFAAHDNSFPEYQGFINRCDAEDYDQPGFGEDMGLRGIIVTLRD